MNKPVLRFAIVFGTCVIAASLFSGCAAPGRADRVPMRAVDLANWHHDCKHKAEQVAMLQQMRQTQDERAMSQLANALTPWNKYTNPDPHRENRMQGMGQNNWYINYHLLLLARDCP
jgi:outer membrane murein-binding lipoprotein Lpp